MDLDLDVIRQMAGARSFQRGREYAGAGLVGRIQHVAGGVRATVRGSDDYAVELTSGAEGGLAHRCSCPMGASGAFCKHCVALGIAAAESGRPEPPDPRAYLENLSHDELVELILDAAQRDEVLQTRLAFGSAAPDSGHDLRRVIEDAIHRIRGTVVPVP